MLLQKAGSPPLCCPQRKRKKERQKNRKMDAKAHLCVVHSVVADQALAKALACRSSSTGVARFPRPRHATVLLVRFSPQQLDGRWAQWHAWPRALRCAHGASKAVQMLQICPSLGGPLTSGDLEALDHHLGLQVGQDVELAADGLRPLARAAASNSGRGDAARGAQQAGKVRPVCTDESWQQQRHHRHQ